VKDTSRNLMPIDVFMMGEGFHNNHHTYGNRANFAFKWYEIDPTYQVIKLLNFVGVIRLPKEKTTTKVFLKKKEISEAA
jgi:stearoyl-CoA desaturase (delta-9 desaturase)